MHNSAIKDARKILGLRIRALRKAAGMTQEELGDKSSLNYKFIGELERGRVNVSLDSLVKLADALEVKPASFFPSDNAAARPLPTKENNPLSKLSSRELLAIRKTLQLLNKTFHNL